MADTAKGPGDSGGEENTLQTVVINLRVLPKSAAIISIIIGISCFGLALWSFFMVISSGSPLIDQGNFHYMLGALFFSGVLLIIVPLYFGTEWQKIVEKEEEKKEEEKKEEEKKFSELISEIYNELISCKEKPVEWVVMKMGKYAYYKNLLKNDSGITIGIHKIGNLYVTMENAEQAKLFCEANEKWHKTTTHSASIYCEDDENVLDRNPKDIVERIIYYTTLINKTTKL